MNFNFSKLPGKQWVYFAFGAVIAGLLSMMWAPFPLLMIVVGFLAFFYWFQKYGRKQTKSIAKPPTETTQPPVK